MRLLLILDDMCYYEYKGEIVWFKNKSAFKERALKGRLQSLKDKGQYYDYN